jgi:hypothetical protein
MGIMEKKSVEMNKNKNAKIRLTVIRGVFVFSAGAI